MRSAVARSGLCGLMGVCVVVPGGGFRQTVDPFTKIPRNLAVFAQWVCTLAEWLAAVMDVPRGLCLGVRYAALAGASVSGMGFSRGVHSA